MKTPAREFFFVLCIFCVAKIFAQSQNGELIQGTVIPVVFTQVLSSDNEGTVPAIVAQDISDTHGKVLIPKGTPVDYSLASIPAKSVGKPGNLAIAYKSIKINNHTIELSGSTIINGKSRTGLALAGTIGCFFVFPLDLLFLLIEGKDAVVTNADTLRDATVAGNYILGNGGNLSLKTNEEQFQYRGGGDPMKGLNVNKAKDMVIGNYYALIVGIDKYSGAWQPLKNAVGDAKAIEALLREEYKIDHFRALYNEQATRKNIILEMEWLAKNATEKDNVLIYYSGHGEYKKELNKGYWVPIDAQTNSTSDYISNNDIQTFLSGIKSKHTLLVSDACFSGDIFRGNTLTVPFEDSERYYKEVHNLPSRQALTSGGIEPVMDGGREGHSVFAYYLLKSLISNQNKYYDASQLYSTIKIPVTNNSEQSPQFQSIKNTGDEGGQFIFIKK